MSAPTQIKSFYDRWERLEAEKKDIGELLKDLFAEAKSFGYDTKALRAAFRLKAKQDLDNPADAEFELIVDTYLDALNGLARDARLHARENIEKFDPETGEILSDQPASDDTPIIPPSPAESEAEEISAIQFQAKASGEQTGGTSGHLGCQPLTGDASRPSRGGDTPATNSPSEDGVIAAVNPRAGLADANGVEPSSSVPIAPASQGEAEAPSAERVTPHIPGSAAANAGGDHVDAHEVIAATAGAAVSAAPAISIIRPHCKNPGENCPGYGRKHCRACEAAILEEVA